MFEQTLLKKICKGSHGKIIEQVLSTKKVQCLILKQLHYGSYRPPKENHTQPKGRKRISCPRKLPTPLMVHSSRWEDPRGIDIYRKYPWE